jgi:hypothetical protein
MKPASYKPCPMWHVTGVLLMSIAGCAHAYHDYPCGCVPYGYCPPQPLAYTGYAACPTPMAERFASEFLRGETAE